MSTRRIVAEWLRDSAIGFLLLVGGIAIVDVLRLSFGWKSRLLYSPCMCIGLLPFLWFAKRKGAIASGFPDLFAFMILGVLSASVLSYPSAAAWLHEHTYYCTLVFAISVLGPIWLYRGIREFCTSKFSRKGPDG